MLKIKDDYDLNNLKKYGFEHCVRNYEPLCDFDCQTKINWDYWLLTLGCSEYHISKDKIIDAFTAMEECPIELDVLYDMIQDGIVEKESEV